MSIFSAKNPKKPKILPPFRDRRFKSLNLILATSISAIIGITIIKIIKYPNTDLFNELDLILAFFTTTSTTIIGVFIGTSLDKDDDEKINK